MKKQLQPKHKVMLGVGSGLLGATAIATPLAVVLSQDQISTEGNFDIQYGMDKAAYNKMKEQFTLNYAAKLEAEHIFGPERERAMASLNKTFGVFDRQVTQLTQNKTKNTYTAATSAMLRIARFNYGVDLERKSRANWNEVEDMFGNMLESFTTYMDNNHYPEEDITRLINDATARKDAMMDKLKVEYENDVLGGVLKAKAQLFSFFDSVNNEIAKLAGMTRLNEFMTNYTLIFRNDAKSYEGVDDVNANRVDTLKASGELTVGAAISTTTMNKLFVCFNNETKQEVPFDTAMLPGYELTPTLKGFVDDGITNDHKILIDWSIVSNNAKDAEQATAHLVDVDNSVVDAAKQDKVKSINDMFNITDEKVKLTDYNVFATKTTESNLLAATYFNEDANGEKIEFTWDKTYGAQPCYDGFMYADQGTTQVQKLTLRQLAQTGVVIKCGSDARLLKDVIALVDQDNYEPKNMIEKFVRYCDVEDEIVIDGNNVSNSFNAYYKNATYWKQNYQEGLCTVNFGTQNALDFEISENFYTSVNTSYNLAHRQSYHFLDRGYDKIADDAIATEVVNGICLGIATATMIYLMGKLTAYIFTNASWGKIFGATIVIFVQAAIIKFMVDAFNRFHDRYVKPVMDYKHKADGFSDSGAADHVRTVLSRDEHLFILYDKDHPVDPAVFQQKIKEFRTLDKVEQKKYFRLYTYFTIEEAGGKTFFSKAFELGIDPDHFKNDIGCWEKHSIEFGICFSLMGLSISSIFFIKAMDAPSKGMGTKGPADAELTATTQAGTQGATAVENGTKVFEDFGIEIIRSVK